MSAVVVVPSACERIVVGARWILQPGALARELPASTQVVAVVTDMTADALCAQAVEAALVAARPEWRVLRYVMPEGEASKSRLAKELLEDWLLAQGAPRSSTTVVAVGGGVVGDLAGFVAATYQRGVPVVQVPTTLLAMVDSAVGGKTALDVPAGKNLVGAFHHPHAVCVDVAWLATLSARHLANGMAEVIKMAVALDAAFFQWLERAAVAELLARHDDTALMHCVRSAIALKAAVVDDDHLDRGGRRNILNAGHTVGHALEALLAPSWLHGECVAVGLMVEGAAALHMGIMEEPALLERLGRALRLHGLRVDVPTAIVDLDAVLRFAAADKKAAKAGELRCVLLAALGRVGTCVTYAVDAALMRALLSPLLRVAFSSSSSSSSSSLPSSDAVVVRVPGSKSLSNRLLLLAAMAHGDCVLKGLLHAQDTYAMLDALEAMGVACQWNAAGDELLVRGCGGQLRAPAAGELFVANAGTAARFLTAMCAWLPVGQSAVIRGVPRLHERPVQALVDALRRVGVTIECLEREGSFPLRVHGRNGFDAHVVMEVESGVSSQFTSALLMAAAVGGRGASVRPGPGAVSQLYVELTLDALAQFGVAVLPGYEVPAGARLQAGAPVMAVEADASSATYPLAWAALHGARVQVTNLGSASRQGDARFVALLERMGCSVQQTAHTTTVRGAAALRALGTVDMAEQTDAFMTLAVLAARAEGVTRIVGITNQRVKECDRIAATVAGLRACGVQAAELSDGLEIQGTSAPVVTTDVTIECHNDHRLAMSFALLGGGIIVDRRCVGKTFPAFWHMLQSQFGATLQGSTKRQRQQQQQQEQQQQRDEERQQVRYPVVVLIGMRGSGKSTLGPLVAQRLGRRFVDADAAFALQHGCTPPEYVAHHGMAAFRASEVQVLHGLLQTPPSTLLVVACGGGIVETPQGRALLGQHSVYMVVVHVRRPWHVVRAGLEAAQSQPQRVALVGESLDEVWDRRRPHYEALSHVEAWSGERDTIEGAATALYALVQQQLHRRQAHVPWVRLGTATTMVCATLATYTAGADLAWLATARTDAVELRVDLLTTALQCNDGGDALRDELRALRDASHHALPVVWTARGVHRLDVLEVGARAGCAWVDVEAANGAADEAFCVWAYEHCRVGLIVSEHNTTDAPVLPMLRDMALRCRSKAPALPTIIKVAATARSAADCDVMHDFVRAVTGGALSGVLHPQSPGLIAVLMGPQGVLSRLRCPLLAPCTHEALPMAAAPGQLAVAEWNQWQARLSLAGPCRELLLFGHPIARSPSPAVHNAALPVDYLRYRLNPCDHVDAVAAAVANPLFVGANVTIPLKEAVLNALVARENASAAALAIGACNTLWRHPRTGALHADNTDWQGMVALLHADVALGGAVVIIGAGGTARAACFAARQMGARQLVICNRTLARAEVLARQFGGTAVASLAALSAAPGVIIACVPGSAPVVELPAAWLRPGSDLRSVLECSYLPRDTPLLLQLPEHVRRVYGWELLLEQALCAWRVWNGGREPPREAMREALLKNTP